MMKNFDLKQLRNIQIKKDSLLLISAITITIMVVLTLALTMPISEPVLDPPSVPINKPRFKPGTVIYSDELPKSKEVSKPDISRRERS